MCYVAEGSGKLSTSGKQRFSHPLGELQRDYFPPKFKLMVPFFKAEEI